MIGKKELFARLAGDASSVTVVTPNTRLAQALHRDFDSFQIGKGLSSWEAPDLLPLSAFVERLYEDALYSSGPELPTLLTPSQEQWLWREAIGSRDLLQLDETAAQCRAAWSLLHQWRLHAGPGNEDTQAFASWCEVYKKKTLSSVDAARLPDLVRQHLSKKPKLLVAYGFDILPPQTRELFSAFEWTECLPTKKDSSVRRAAFSSAKEELQQAAAWARARVEANPKARIGVVVPAIEERRAEVVRVFSRLMQPAHNLPGATETAVPFNVSLGLPLHKYSLVNAALQLIRFSQEEIPFSEASYLVLSPFIGGAEREMGARAKLDVRLRRKLGASVSLPKLIGTIQGAPLLRDLLERLFKYRESGAQSPSSWARHFSALLDAAGFPGERGLDSAEFQARAKFHEVLGELAKLERVSSHLSFSRAFGELRRLCSETLFQPESEGDAPIQVLGVLESAGIEFDHLWVSGLTEEAWPLPAHANPFLPIAAQKKAGIPQASAETSIAVDERITEGWASAAAEVIFSSFEKEQDRVLAPSPLIASIPVGKLVVPAFPRLRDLISKSAKLAAIEDSVGPAVAAKGLKGGTRVLSDQAACPFRAYAHWRLSAQEMESPSEGLDASDRGRLLHALMSSLWARLKNSDSLNEDFKPAIDAAAAAAVKELQLEGRFAELEKARLARLAADWLEIEKTREPFQVLSIEQPVSFALAGITYQGRIDRMDKTKDGHVLIDYKTSRNPSPSQWRPPRPDDPQLPLYAVTSEKKIVGVAFAKVRPGEMRLMGFSETENLLPGVRKAKNWPSLLEEWKEEAQSLGKSFASGQAAVDPKKGLHVTCRLCDLHTLCRVYEKLNPLKEDEEPDGEGTGE